jgi:hypothetical protein
MNFRLNIRQLSVAGFTAFSALTMAGGTARADACDDAIRVHNNKVQENKAFANRSSAAITKRGAAAILDGTACRNSEEMIARTNSLISLSEATKSACGKRLQPSSCDTGCLRGIVTGLQESKKEVCALVGATPKKEPERKPQALPPQTQTAKGPVAANNDTPCTVSKPSDITGLPGGSSSAAAKPAKPCVRVPGWTHEQPYNHEKKPVSVQLHDGTIIVLPAYTENEQWGIWREANGRVKAKKWDKTTGMKSGVGGPDGCAPLTGEGWPGPRCEENRQVQRQETLKEADMRSSVTAAECKTKMRGEIFDAVDGTITKSECEDRRGGRALPIDSGENETRRWPPNSKGCYFKGSKKWIPERIYDPQLPARLCRYNDRGLQFMPIRQP